MYLDTFLRNNTEKWERNTVNKKAGESKTGWNIPVILKPKIKRLRILGQFVLCSKTVSKPKTKTNPHTNSTTKTSKQIPSLPQ